MNINEFGECFEYNIKHNIKHAILGLGAPGVGKSQIIRQIGKKYNFKVIDIRLAQMSEVEIGGLIYPNESRTKTVWLAPEVLPNEERDGKNTILLLDEITSCNKRVQVAAYQLILDRRIGQYQLPEGTFVVALGNREDDDGVYIKLAGPLADRFEIHYIEPDFNSWKYDFALKNGVHPWVIDYLTSKPKALHTQEQDGESMVFATPRSWVCVSDILNCEDDLSNPIICYKIIGNIGQREGSQFVEYCKKLERNKKSLVDVNSFIEGKCKAPDSPADIRLLIDGACSYAEFVVPVTDKKQLSSTQITTIEKIANSFTKFPASEFTMVGLKKLLKLNHPVVKEVLLESKLPRLEEFIKSNSYALNFSDVPSTNKKGESPDKWKSIWSK